MKVLGIFLFCAFLGCIDCFSFVSVLNEEWEAFKLEFGKKYTSPIEEAFRKKIYAETKHKVALHNQDHFRGKFSFKVEMNEFADMLPNEFFKIMNGVLYNKTASLERRRLIGISFIEPDDDVVMPKQVDWRTKGAVTPIKNQGRCGSCWAFSSTGSLEGQHFRKTGKLVSLSEQNLMDCSHDMGNYGCEGGLMDNAFEYVKENHGIDTEESYPYEGIDVGKCSFKKKNVGADDRGFVDVRAESEEALKKAVATVGPVSVAIDASHDSFMSYAEGVYYEENCDEEQLDHGVLVVGYGTTEDKEDYWLVKNSWGEMWGEDGYIRMSRNRDNNCGIASSASYPLV